MAPLIGGESNFGSTEDEGRVQVESVEMMDDQT